MRTGLQRLLLFTVLFITALNLSAQDAYRTNVTSTVAQWTNIATWQRFDTPTSTWVAADHFPTYLDGVITIQAGDSIQMSGATSAGVRIDQVVVDPGGILVFFNNQNGNVTLNDGAGDDIIVDGKLYVATAGRLDGSAKIQVNDGGLFTIRNTGLLTAFVNNDGTMHWGANGQNAGVFTGCLIVNNDTCVWINGNTNMVSNTTFVNNGTLWITPTTGNLHCYNSSFEKIINNGTILNTGSAYSVDFEVRMDNRGIIGGVGTLTFSEGVDAGGIISPGMSPGRLIVSPSILINPTINIEISTTGAVAGVNYDQLTINAGTSLIGATINVTNTANDPVNTQYTIINVASGTLGNDFPYAIINAPSNFSAAFTGSALVLTKTALVPLPVTWGRFDAIALDNKVSLAWTTLMEQNTSHFIIEHSTNASTFTPIANIDAQENSAYEAHYKYFFTSPDLSKTNYFRIKQVDLDGKSTYSVTRTVWFDHGRLITFQAYPNPVKDVLQLNIQTKNVQVSLADLSGKTIQQLTLQPGQYSVNMQSLPNGIYYLNFFVKGKRVETKKIIKQ